MYLNDQWSCTSGHGWDRVHNWYDAETGAAVTPYWLQPAPVAAPATVSPQPPPAPAPAAVVAPAPPPAPAPAPQPMAASRVDLLGQVLAMLGQYPGYVAQYGTDTDIVIGNQVADASWGTGKKKIEYSAILKAVEPERTIYFWEILKEKGAGLSFGGVETESYSTFGTKRSGTTKQIVLGPSGVEMDASWDYGATRQMIEGLAQQNGWMVKTVLKKSAAQY